MLIRMPSAECYAEHVDIELQWLPYLQEHLPFPIPAPIGCGKPGAGYPMAWSVLRYLPGETITHENVTDEVQLARDLAAWLQKLQSVSAVGGPMAGAHNFYRGGSLAEYDEETRKALSDLAAVLPVEQYRRIWEEALESEYTGEPVWVHGDVAVGNLLVQDGRLSAMIDFGTMGVGDPACDYVMAWTFFGAEARKAFLAGLDEGTVRRAKGWAVWKALITYVDENPEFAALARVVLKTLLEE